MVRFRFQKQIFKSTLVMAEMAEPSLKWDRAMIKRSRAGRRAKLLAQMDAEFGG